LKQRFYPLDIFRGATVAFMILVNNPGSWSYVYAPLDHARWHGCTPTDLVFPFFLFAVGNAMAFTMPKLQQQGSAIFWKKTIKRAVLIFVIGLLLNWFPFVKYNEEGRLVVKDFAHLRILGVLQRIALCYFFSSIIIYYAKPAKAFIIGILLLLLYWAMCLFWGNPQDPFSLQGWFGTVIDSVILGKTHMYHGEGIAFDPEGLLSTLPAIMQVILGYLVSDYILQKRKRFDTASGASASIQENNLYIIVANLFVVAGILVFTGFCWDMVFPINKKIWTSSFVIYTTGIAIMVLATLIYVLEIKAQKRAWSRFFDVFGKNPLFIFVLSGVWVRLYGLVRIPDGIKDGKPVVKGLGGWMYDHIFVPAFGNMNGSLMYAVFHIAIFWSIAWWLDKKKIYIKV
jgi:predicted acyltransferase